MSEALDALEKLTIEDTLRYLRLNCEAHVPLVEELIAAAKREKRSRELLKEAVLDLICLKSLADHIYGKELTERIKEIYAHLKTK